MRLKFLVVFALCCGLVPATAGVIYDNGGPDDELIGDYSDFQFGQIVADDFVLAEGANVIRDVHWWGGYDPEQFAADDFILAIFEDDGGLPDTSPLTVLSGSISRSDSGLNDPLGFDIYQYDMVLDTEVALSANTTYWLLIVNDVDGWFWQPSNRLGDHAFVDDSGVWQEDVYEQAFRLTDDVVVPEPASMALLGLGLAGLALRRKISAK